MGRWLVRILLVEPALLLASGELSLQGRLRPCMPQQRDYFRIPYPVPERPRLIVGTREYEIVDLSESGARIGLECESPAGTEPFPAIVRFRDGTTVNIVAAVQR